MESRKHHRFQAGLTVAVVLAASLSFTATAVAEEDPIEDPVDTWVTTGPDAVTVEAEMTHSNGGVSGTGTQASGGPSCYLREVRELDDYLTEEYFRRRMRYAPYEVICGNENRGIVWIEIDLTEPGDGDSGRITSREIALRLRDRMPIPQVTVEINPDRGLVGAESWFWIDGYNGRVLTNSTDAFGDLVEVEARVVRYEWSFGDGTTLVSDSPGQPYPARSEVRHVYERSSAGFVDGYEVVASFVFAVRYRIGDGDWIELPGITRIAEANYSVRESQSVIQR